MNNNFVFLETRFPALEKMGSLAEAYLYSDPNTCFYKMGSLAETLVNYIFELDNLKPPSGNDNTHANRIKILQREKIIPKEIDNILYTLRIRRNEAVHEGYDSFEDCQTLLEMAHTLSVWFMQVYGDDTYEPSDFILPDDIRNQANYQQLLEDNEKLSAELELMKAASLSALVDASVQSSERKRRADRAARKLRLSEKEMQYLEVEQLHKKWGSISTVSVYAVSFMTVLAVIETAVIGFAAILSGDISINLMVASILGAFVLALLFAAISFKQVKSLCFSVCYSYFRAKKYRHSKKRDGKIKSEPPAGEENK